MTNKRDISVSFSGHRSCSCDVRFSRGHLDDTIEELYSRGYSRFLGGTAVGFDLEAAESLLRLRDRLGRGEAGVEYRGPVELVSVLPYAGQGERFGTAERRRLAAVLEASDEVITLSPTYYKSCYLRRDDYLVEQCSLLLCFYDGSPGGTRYTVERARRAHIPVVNLCPSQQLELDF